MKLPVCTLPQRANLRTQLDGGRDVLLVDGIGQIQPHLFHTILNLRTRYVSMRFLSQLVFQSHRIVIRITDYFFLHRLAIWIAGSLVLTEAVLARMAIHRLPK